MGRSMTDQTVSAASYGGAAFSVIAGLTLTDWGVLFGIITAVATLLANLAYQWRRDRRERIAHELHIARLRVMAGQSEPIPYRQEPRE